jgi:hypothetical protein
MYGAITHLDAAAALKCSNDAEAPMKTFENVDIKTKHNSR